MSERYDIAIVGGGPVGLGLAAALAGALRGIRIALVDRRDLAVPKDQRASSISAGVRRVFEQVGIWPSVAAGAEPVRRMKITDSGRGDLARPLFLQFSGDVAPGEPFAHLVPNARLAAALIERVRPLVDVIAPAEISGFVADAREATLSLKDGRTVRASLLVAADGANSLLRQLAGIKTLTRDYRQVGIVTTIGHALPHEGTAYEHFLPPGPFASLPLPGTRSSLVWTERPEAAEALKALPAAEAALRIEAAMGSCLGAVSLDEGLQIYPLRLRLAESFVAPRLALVGDAAHVIHPIAGQGLNLGLKDAAALAEAAIESLRLGLDPGSDTTLLRYQRWRRFDTQRMAAITDTMNRLFSNDSALLRAARDLGLGLVDRLPMLKEAMIASAAGLDPAGPRLTRGLPI